MQSATALIDTFIGQVKSSELISSSCEAIRAFEGGTLPVPIKKTYFSFAAEENTVAYTTDSNGNTVETDTLTIRMNCFIPLGVSIAFTYTVAESVLLMLCTKNKGVTGFTVGKAEYDNDVDAYKITGKIYFTSVVS